MFLSPSESFEGEFLSIALEVLPHLLQFGIQGIQALLDGFNPCVAAIIELTFSEDRLQEGTSSARGRFAKALCLWRNRNVFVCGCERPGRFK